MRIVDYFHQGMERGPDRVAFIDPDRSLTFREVDDMSAHLAGRLHELSYSDGSRTAVFSPNDAVAFVCVLTLFRAGNVWLPVNVRNPADVNAAYLARTGCEVLFFHSSLADEVEEIRQRVPSLRLCVCIDDDVPVADTSVPRILAEDRPPVGVELEDDPNRIVSLFPTGGTTGLAKAAEWPQRVWEAGTTAFWLSCPSDRPAVHLVAAPMTHGAGAVALWCVPGGTTNVILRKADPLAIMTAIQDHRVTHLYLPPTVIYMILAHPDVHDFDFSSLQYLLVAAAPISPDYLREAMSVFNAAVCQSFGQAEAPMFLTFLSSRDLLEAAEAGESERFASCGRATIGTRVEIMGEDGTLLPAGSRGEIVARSRLVFNGYYGDTAATADVSRHGWHHTGDVGYKDEAGFVYIVDRKKDMIITGGFNVYSAEVESVLLGHPAVQDGVVVGVPDEKWGESIRAVLQLKPGNSATVDELRDSVRQRLGGVAAPKAIEFWEDLPRSSNGKVLKAEIRATFWTDTARSVS